MSVSLNKRKYRIFSSQWLNKIIPVCAALTLTGCITSTWGEKNLQDYNQVFNQFVPIQPQYQVARTNDNEFNIVLHQGAPLISSGSVRYQMLSDAGRVIAKKQCKELNLSLVKDDFNQHGNSGWVHLTGSFACGKQVVHRKERVSQKSNPQSMTSGTGFHVSPSYVLTNAHVIKECRNVRINGYQSVEIAGYDEANDLGLLKVSPSVKTIAKFSDNSSVKRGQPVIALGYPLSGLLAAEASVSEGIVSARAGLGNDKRFLQVSAPVQPGNSGGPLLDQHGRVIGVIVSKLNAVAVARITGDIPQNVNFVIKSEIAKAFLSIHGVGFTQTQKKLKRSIMQSVSEAEKYTVKIVCGG